MINLNQYTFNKEFKVGTRIYHQNHGEVFISEILYSHFNNNIVFGLKLNSLINGKRVMLRTLRKFSEEYNNGDFYKL